MLFRIYFPVSLIVNNIYGILILKEQIDLADNQFPAVERKESVFGFPKTGGRGFLPERRRKKRGAEAVDLFLIICGQLTKTAEEL